MDDDFDSNLSNDEDEDLFREMDITFTKLFQKLNRHRLSISYSESGIQLSPMEPPVGAEEGSEKDAIDCTIQTQSDTNSLSSSAIISAIDSIHTSSEAAESDEYLFHILLIE